MERRTFFFSPSERTSCMSFVRMTSIIALISMGSSWFNSAHSSCMVICRYAGVRSEPRNQWEGEEGLSMMKTG